MFYRIGRIAILSGLLATTTACVTGVDPYRGVRQPVFARGNAPLTAQVVAHQQNVVQPRCEQVARETTPSRTRMGIATAINRGTGMALGGGGNNAATSQIITGGVDPTTVGAVMVGNAIYGGVTGFIDGRVRVGEIRHGKTGSCMAMDAAGIHAVPPSEADQIRQTGQPRSYGRTQPAQQPANRANGDRAADNGEPDDDDQTVTIISPTP